MDAGKITILDDKYALLETIGNGSFSQVKLGLDLNSLDKLSKINEGRKYAVKVFKTPSKESEVMTQI